MENKRTLKKTGVAEDLVLYYDESSGHGIGLSELIALKKARNAGILREQLTRLDKVVGGLPEPSIFHPPKTNPSGKELVLLFRQNRIRTLTGSSIVLNPVLEDVDGVLMPDVHNPPSELPYFRPNYNYNGPDHSMFRLLAELVVEKKIHPRVYNEMLSVANDNFYGGGSLEGQVGRFVAVREVSLAVKDPWNNFLDPRFIPKVRDGYNQGAPNDYDEYSKLMARRFPLPKRPKWMKLQHTSFLALEKEFKEHMDYFVKVQHRSDAGPLWPDGTTREDVIESEIALAEYILERAGTSETEEEFFRDHEWIMLDKMKNKAEVYTRKQYLTKTRNIFATNSFSFFPAHILMLHSHTGAINASDDPDVWSLLGWTPYYGGLMKLIIMVQEQLLEKGYWVSAFADNVYAAQLIDGRMYWFSIDGEKMEACVTNGDVLYYNMRVLDQFWKGGTSQEWENYFLTVNPRLVVDAPALLFNQQVQNNGMGSGSVGTAFYNTAKMIRGLEQLRPLLDAGRPIAKLTSTGWELELEVYRCFIGAGIKVTLESTSDITEILTKPGLYKLDLLGYDATTLEVAGEIMTVPSLDRQRLYKALVFNKKNHDKAGRPKLNPYTNTLLKLVKYRALYLAGGWVDDAIADFLVEACNRAVEFLSDATIRGVAGIREALAILEEDVLQELADAFGAGTKLEGTLGVRAVPTIFEAITLAVGRETAEDVIVNLMQDPATAARIGHYAPEEVVLELLEAGIENVIPEDIVDKMISSQEEKITLRDEGWTTLPGEAPVARPLGNWGDAAEDTVTSKPSEGSRKAATDAPTDDPYRKFASNTKKGKKLKEEAVARTAAPDYRRLNTIIGQLTAASRAQDNGIVPVPKPQYYRDRPDTLRDPENAPRVTKAKQVSSFTGVPIKDVLESFTIAKLRFEFK